MSKTILRVADNVDKKAPVYQKIKDFLGDIEEVNIFLKSRNLNKPCFQRMQALFKAFELCLILSNVENKNDIIQRYQPLFSYFFPEKEELPIEILQNNLAEFKSYLIRDLQEAGLDKKTAEENLEVADKILLSMDALAPLATLQVFDRNQKKRWVLRLDKPLPSCSPKIIEEFNLIKESKLEIIPNWFNSFSVPAKAYLQKTAGSLDLTNGFYKDVLYFITTLRKLEKSKHDFAEICWGLSEPKWFADQTPARKALIKEILLENPEIEKNALIEKLEAVSSEVKKLKLAENKREELKEIKLLPHWFVCLPPFYQAAIAYLLKVREPSDVFHICSRGRFWPGIANMAESHFMIFNEEGVKQCDMEVTRMAHIVPWQLLNTPSIARTMTLNNFEYLFNSEKSILLQTLLSPTPWGFGDDDAKLDEFKTQLLDVFCRNRLKKTGSMPDILATNHPLNLLNAVIARDPACDSFIEQVYSYINESPDSEVRSLLQSYEEALANNNQLLQSSYENLLAMKMGWRLYGGCKNNQDRKGVELIHTAALLLFRDLEEKWPNHANKAERNRFCELFADLYADLHMLSYAERQGAFGLKNTVYYLPNDLQAALQKRLYPAVLKDHNIMGTNIEVSAIQPYNASNLLGWGQSWLLNCIGVAVDEATQKLIQESKLKILQFNLQEQLALLSLLKEIIASPYWEEKNEGYFLSAVTIPTGITYLRKQLETLSCEESSYQVTTDHLLACYLIIKQRPVICDTRRDLTQELYKVFLDFNSQEMYQQLESIYNECYKHKIVAQKFAAPQKKRWLTQLKLVLEEAFWDQKSTGISFFDSETTPPLIKKLREFLKGEITAENASQLLEQCLEAVRAHPQKPAIANPLARLHEAINGLYAEERDIERSTAQLKRFLEEPKWVGTPFVIHEDYVPPQI